MSDQVVEKVTEYIDALAAQLGVAAEHVYSVLVTQMVIEGVAYLVGIVLGLLVSTLVLRKTVPMFLTAQREYEAYSAAWIRTHDKDEERELNYKKNDAERRALIAFIITIIFAILGFFGLMTAVLIGPESVMKIVNPEYYVIREILSVFGK